MIDKIILKVFSVKCINGSKYQIKLLKIKILKCILLKYLILISLTTKKTHTKSIVQGPWYNKKKLLIMELYTTDTV